MNLTSEKMLSLNHIPTREVENDLRDALFELHGYQLEKEAIESAFSERAREWSSYDSKVVEAWRSDETFVTHHPHKDFFSALDAISAFSKLKNNSRERK